MVSMRVFLLVSLCWIFSCARNVISPLLSCVVLLTCLFNFCSVMFSCVLCVVVVFRSIPVIFNPSTIYNQYPYHIGESDARAISVNIPGRSVRFNKVQLMDLLLSIPASVIKEKQAALARVAPRVQYAMPPLHLLADIDDETRWDPPFPDAVDMAINGLMKRASLLKKNMPTGIPETLMTLGEWNTKYSTFLMK